MEDHIVVCGHDGLAARVLEDLLELGEQVVLVTARPEGRAASRARRAAVQVIQDDGDDDWLTDAGVKDAAVVAVLDTDDVGNLHAALAVQECNPDVRLVLRFFNAELGESLEALFGDCETLSASGIAAPAFVHAALHGHEPLPVEIRGRRVAAREAPGEGALGVVVEDVPPPAVPESHSAVGRAARRRWRLLSATFALLDRRTGVVFVLLLALVAGAAVLFHEAAGFAWIDSVYFTLTTVTTTGYGDLNLLEEAPAVKLAGNAVMVLGALLFALLFAFVTDALVSARVARQLGRLPIPKADHAIVCGLGNVGVKVVRELRARGVPCVAVERDEHNPFVDAVRRDGVPVLVGDVSRPETLTPLHVDTTAVVLAVTDDDLANLETALNARALRQDLRVVVRLFSPELATRIDRAFSISISRSLSALAAPAFVAAIVRRRWLATVPVGARALAVAEVPAPPEETTVAELEQRVEARVLEAAGTWRPPGDRALAPGEPLLVLASRHGLATLTT